MKPNTLKRMTICIAIATAMTLPVSCYQKFYKVDRNNSSVNFSSILQSEKGKYFILRSGSNSFYMDSIVISEDNKSLRCTLEHLPEEHLNYLIVNVKAGISYSKSKGEAVVLNEVHIYTAQNSEVQYGANYTLDFNKIEKIDILEKDRIRTATSTIASTLGLSLSVLIVIAILENSTY
ncbi:hypothetical protein BH10BAC2_BH10BAC2_00830 [soil metagenome]